MNVISDLSTITSIPENTVTRLFSCIEVLICNEVYDKFVLQKENNVDINLSFGNIHILKDDDELTFKFTPARSLQDKITDSYINNHNYMIDMINKSINQKIKSTYKDLF